MKRVLKKTISIILAVCCLTGLTGCSAVMSMVSESNEEQIKTLIQGNLDALYLGEYSDDYKEMTDSTDAELEAEYLTGIEVEAEYFASYWGIIDVSYGDSFYDLSEGLRNDIIELYKEIYSYSKYEVASVATQDDGSYSARVLVQPIDIMETASAMYDNDEYGPLNDFWANSENIDFTTMSDEEYMLWTEEYGAIIVQMVKELIPDLSYMEEKSAVIQVEPDEEGYLNVNQDDFYAFDEFVISYPY